MGKEIKNRNLGKKQVSYVEAYQVAYDVKNSRWKVPSKPMFDFSMREMIRFCIGILLVGKVFTDCYKLVRRSKDRIK